MLTNILMQLVKIFCPKVLSFEIVYYLGSPMAVLMTLTAQFL